MSTRRGSRPSGGASRLATGAGALVALTVLAYLPALRGGFIWDDDLHVTQNQLLRTWQGLVDIWLTPGAILQYYPLTHTSWWVQYHLWGLAPLGYHLVNVLLHGSSAAVLWRVLRRLAVPGAWMAAAVFALHPVQVESVAWVTELKNVQSGFFYLLALLGYLRWGLADDAEPAGGRRIYALSFLSFACAVLSKSVTCTLPAAVALILWWKRGRLAPGQVVALVPLAAVSVAAGVLTAWWERHYVGAAGEDWALSLPERCLVAGRALWFYAAKLVWPFELAFTYRRWALEPHAWWPWFFPLGAVAVVVALAALRRRLGPAPLVAALYFSGTLGPALGFVDVYPMRYSFVADHFQYLASIGVITLLVAAGTVTTERILPTASGARPASTRRPRCSGAPRSRKRRRPGWRTTTWGSCSRARAGPRKRPSITTRPCGFVPPIPRRSTTWATCSPPRVGWPRPRRSTSGRSPSTMGLPPRTTTSATCSSWKARSSKGSGTTGGRSRSTPSTPTRAGTSPSPRSRRAGDRRAASPRSR